MINGEFANNCTSSEHFPSKNTARYRTSRAATLAQSASKRSGCCVYKSSNDLTMMSGTDLLRSDQVIKAQKARWRGTKFASNSEFRRSNMPCFGPYQCRIPWQAKLLDNANWCKWMKEFQLSQTWLKGKMTGKPCFWHLFTRVSGEIPLITRLNVAT